MDQAVRKARLMLAPALDPRLYDALLDDCMHTLEFKSFANFSSTNSKQEPKSFSNTEERW